MLQSLFRNGNKPMNRTMMTPSAAGNGRSMIQFRSKGQAKMTRIPHTHPGSWPRLMRAETAAAYVDEKSVDTFRRGVSTIYPLPIKVAGKGDRWLRDDLDQAIDRLSGRTEAIWDAADVL
jgi:hypothetical protein